MFGRCSFAIYAIGERAKAIFLFDLCRPVPVDCFENKPEMSQKLDFHSI